MNAQLSDTILLVRVLCILLLRRSSGLVAFRSEACQLNVSGIGAWLKRYEPVAFLVFCTHGMTAGVWWMVVAWIGASSAPAVYRPYFVTSPLLVLVTSVLIAWVAIAVTPKAFKYLLGGRVPTRLQMQRMFPPISSESHKQFL